MFDAGDSQLKTWALECVPDSRDEQIAHRLADHRMDYLDYQGPLSGGRGHVQSWDHGNYSVLSLASDSWQLHLQGERLVGRVSLSWLGEDVDDWRYCFVPDEPMRGD